MKSFISYTSWRYPTLSIQSWVQRVGKKITRVRENSMGENCKTNWRRILTFLFFFTPLGFLAHAFSVNTLRVGKEVQTASNQSCSTLELLTCERSFTTRLALSLSLYSTRRNIKKHVRCTSAPPHRTAHSREIYKSSDGARKVAYEYLRSALFFSFILPANETRRMKNQVGRKRKKKERKKPEREEDLIPQPEN